MKIFPVYYFPPVSWFAAALSEGEIVLERWQYYRKQHYFNRTEIKTPDKVLRLSIPVRHSGDHTPIGERHISHDWNWRHDHWKSIESALRSAPFFEHFGPRIAAFYEQPVDSLFDLNLATITFVRDALRLPIAWSVTERYLDGAHYAADYREAFSAKGGYMPPWFQPREYLQVFGDVFSPDLSILDLMCNAGPETERILRQSMRAQ